MQKIVILRFLVSGLQKPDSENALVTRFSATRGLARKVLLVPQAIAGDQERARVVRAETAAVVPPPNGRRQSEQRQARTTLGRQTKMRARLRAVR